MGANLGQLGGSQGFLGAALFGQLGASAIAQGVQMVGSGIQAAIGSIQTAARTQINDLALAGDLASQLGVNFNKAKGLVAETANEISKMAEQLPGENKDYNAIFNQISATVAGNSKGDISKFKEESMELTKRFGILASVRGLDANQSGSAINRALAGTMGLREVFQIDIFQKFPLLQKNITDQLKAMGKGTDDWMKLTNETREKILLNGAKGAVTDDTVNSFSGTVDSMIAEANSYLFDERRGMFGFLKKLPGMQDRSVMDAVQGSMISFKGLLESLGSLGNRFGLAFDPMEAVIRVFDWFSDLAGTVNGVLNGEKSATISDFFINTNRALIDGFNRIVNKFSDITKTVNWGDFGKQIGRTLTVSITEWITRLDWGAIAVSLLELGKSSLETQAGLVYGAIQGLFESINNTIRNIPTNTLKAVGINTDNPGVKSSLDMVGNTFKWGSSIAAKFAGPLGTLYQIGETNNLANPGKPLDSTMSTNGTGNLVTPLVIPKTPDANKQAFAPTVNVSGIQMQNPQDVASAVMRTINAEYGKFKQNSLA
ncbi:hypothetical protein [uncultured Nostoc sp.]|uniref:hypothetical protein n=1 Tax=uncultured Nostoc sp. TaxID=340711 RepID=UPI0035CB2AE8